LKAHWGSIAAADFLTTEVWTWQGLVTYYTVFIIDLASRRVQILGSTPHPEALFMQQIVRTLTMAEADVVSLQVLICDRDRKWSRDVRRRLQDAGIRVVLIPERAPNANAYAERLSGRSRKNVLIASFQSVSGTSGTSSRSSSSTIIASGTTKGSTTN
jgi:putative transposase